VGLNPTLSANKKTLRKMSNSFEHFEKRFFSLLGRLRRHKGWMSETTQLASEINPTERV
jgi:hypothetical protein